MQRNRLPLVAVATLALAPAAAGQAPGNSTGFVHPERPAVVRPPSSSGGARAGLNVLVYDSNTQHQLAQTAAFNIEPTGTVVATSTDFDTQLAVGGWDVVVVDCPSTVPSAGWAALANYVTAGGAAIVSYWDWDNNFQTGIDPLRQAFEVNAPASGTFSWNGNTINDLGTSQIFNGVTMPNFDWHDHWSDDGDQFTPTGSAIGLADIGQPTRPCIVLGNNGLTIAAPVFDESGDTWINSGEAVVFWENLINQVLNVSLTGDVTQISLSTGGQQVLSMNLGQPAGLKTYQILGSVSGAVPGIVYTSTAIPLNPDAYTVYTLLNPNTPPLLNSAGTLDVNGKATAVFILPPATDPALVGLVVNHAGITIDVVGPNIVVSMATDAVPCTLVP